MQQLCLTGYIKHLDDGCADKRVAEGLSAVLFHSGVRILNYRLHVCIIGYSSKCCNVGA